MSNYINDNENSEDIYYLFENKINQQGGDDKDKEPHGGFPPIYIVTDNDEPKNKIDREFSSRSKSISIKDILKHRKTQLS